MAALLLSALLLIIPAILTPAVAVTRAKNACPCSDPSLCKPLNVPDRPELLGFITNGTNWKYYNYTYITTIAVFVDDWDPQLICTAHEKDVRVVLHANFDPTRVTDPVYRVKWIQTYVQNVIDVYADGINVDFEDPISYNQTDVNTAFVQLIADLYVELKKEVPGSQLSIDVAWSPACIDGRCFDHYGLSKFVDFMVIMAYDESSQVLGPCIAMANSPLLKTMQGLLEFINNGVSRDKLVLGLPWYGYDYSCTKMNNAGECELAYVPFRGIPCSDAAGSQRSITEMVYKYLKLSDTGRMWNNTMKSPFFNFNSTDGSIHQAWYDDPESLGYKYLYAARAQIRGLAIWNFDHLDYQNSETVPLNVAMWSTFDVFFKK